MYIRYSIKQRYYTFFVETAMSKDLNLRPQFFRDVVGNEINNKLLLSMAKSDYAPSTIIMAGSYGTGKTTCSRIFSRAVNCECLSDDICGVCPSCKMSYDDNLCYSEFDSSLTNRVENIRDLYEDLTWVPKGKKRVITFDEFHLTSRAAQSALLKLFEDAPQNIFYVLCTTDKNAILPAIVSRSLTLEFNTKSKEEVISNLYKIANSRNINCSYEVSKLLGCFRFFRLPKSNFIRRFKG